MICTSSPFILPLAFTILPIIFFLTLLGLAILVTLPWSSTKTMSPDLSLQVASQVDLAPSCFTHLELQTIPVISIMLAPLSLSLSLFLPLSSVAQSNRDEQRTITSTANNFF